MTGTSSTTTITAAPCGKDRHGQPLKPRQYVVDSRREDWGDGRSRIFVRRPDLDAYPGQDCFAPEIVRTNSIVEEQSSDTVRCSHPTCSFPATRQAYVADWDGSPWAAEVYAPYCAGHAPAESWALVESEAGPMSNMPTTALPSQITVQAAALVRILQAADSAQIPLGHQYIAINARGFELQMGSAEEVGIWARWIDGHVTTTPTEGNTGTIYRTRGVIHDLEYGDLHIEAYTVEYQQAEAVA